LVLTVGCNVLNGDDGGWEDGMGWSGISIGCVLMVAIYAMGGISGAHFNPAVSFSIFLSTPATFKVTDMLMYWVAQIFGGLSAAVVYMHMMPKSFDVVPKEGFGLAQAGLCEFFYTFMLCFVILNVAVAKSVQGNQYYGLAIGFVIVAGAYGAGVVSGGCFNPAVALAIDTAGQGNGFGLSLKYILFELAGAAMASVFVRIVRPEDFGFPPTSVSAFVAEFLGTFFLVLTVGLNILGHSSAGPFSIAAALMSMIYALGDVSGAHFNPAVTVAVFGSRRDEGLSPGKAVAYIVVQILGGVAAAFAYTHIYSGLVGPINLGPQLKVGGNETLKEMHTWNEVALAEIIYTFVLCFTVLTVAVSTTTKSTVMFGLAIGACVTIGGNAIGAISGGSLNPAVSFGLADLEIAGKYALFEIIGAVLAAGIFFVTHESDVDKDAEDDAEDEAE